MNAIFKLDRQSNRLYHAEGMLLDPSSRVWVWTASPPPASSEAIDAIAAATWLQRESEYPLRIPVGVVGPREASTQSLITARKLGFRLARMGFTVLCGGRQGVMEAVCRGVQEAGGLSVGLLPEGDADVANPYVSLALATGVGEARNALIARASLCLVAVGDSYGTLSEIALGLHFGKRVVGLEGAAKVEGVRHVPHVDHALSEVAAVALGFEPERMEAEEA